jgi:hypothetical protein
MLNNRMRQLVPMPVAEKPVTGVHFRSRQPGGSGGAGAAALGKRP